MFLLFLKFVFIEAFYVFYLITDKNVLLIHKLLNTPRNVTITNQTTLVILSMLATLETFIYICKNFVRPQQSANLGPFEFIICKICPVEAYAVDLFCMPM